MIPLVVSGYDRAEVDELSETESTHRADAADISTSAGVFFLFCFVLTGQKKKPSSFSPAHFSFKSGLFIWRNKQIQSVALRYRMK